MLKLTGWHPAILRTATKIYTASLHDKKLHLLDVKNRRDENKDTGYTQPLFYQTNIVCYFPEQLSTFVWAVRQTSSGNTINEPTETGNQYLSHKIMTMYQVLWERHKCAAERIGSAFPALICSSVLGMTSCGLVRTFRRNQLPTTLVLSGSWFYSTKLRCYP